MEVLSTGIVAALASTYLLRWTQRSSLDPEQTIKYFRSIPQNLIDITVNLAKHYRVDRDLAMTILYIEYTQRPPWTQRIEKTLNKVGVAKTIGVYQANRRRVETLISEVEPAMANLSNSIMPRSHGYGPKQSLLIANLEKHNKGDDFLRLAENVFNIISQDATPTCQKVAEDGTPAIRKLGERREGMRWRIWGDMAPEVGTLRAVTHDYEDPHSTNTVRKVHIKEGRHRPIWTVHFDLPHDTLVISAPADQNAYSAPDPTLSISINPSPYS
jgi:hypothetical protein